MGVQHESEHFVETLEKTLDMGLVPIINENDAIADEEIKVGDNDRLSALIAAAIHLRGTRRAVKLVLLSDIDGLYAEYGTVRQKLIRSVTDIDTVVHFAEGSGSAVGTGGMRTKLEAARIAVNAGVDMYITNVAGQDVVNDVLLGKTGTHFVAKQVT